MKQGSFEGFERRSILAGRCVVDDLNMVFRAKVTFEWRSKKL